MSLSILSIVSLIPQHDNEGRKRGECALNKLRETYGTAFRATVNAGKKMFSTPHRLAAILSAEGVLFTLIITLCNNNNQLFASRLGASSYQLGMISSLPPIVGMICLIPFAIVTDRLKNKRIMVIIAAMLLGIMYFLVGTVPLISHNPVTALIVLLVMVNFPMSLYGSSWQSFFSDVALPLDRNEIFAHRTKMNTAVGIVFPLIIGMILTIASGPLKIFVHQIYYYLALPLAFGQLLLLRKIHVEPKSNPNPFRFSGLVRTAISTFRSRTFLGFLGVALLVYASWQMDWSIYFIAQFKYLELSEVQMSLVAVLSALTQFLTMGLWTRISATKGIRFVFIIGIAGFAFCSLVMLTSLLLPLRAGVGFYYLFHCIGSSTYSAFQFSILLCLLEVIPSVNKTLAIAIYSTVILVSNVIMPMTGVHFYNLFGENRQAMVFSIAAVAFLRILATTAAIIRYRIYKGKTIDSEA